MTSAQKRRMRKELARGFRQGGRPPGDPKSAPRTTSGVYLVGQAVAREFRTRGRKPTAAELRAVERNVLSIPKLQPIPQP